MKFFCKNNIKIVIISLLIFTFYYLTSNILHSFSYIHTLSAKSSNIINIIKQRYSSGVSSFSLEYIFYDFIVFILILLSVYFIYTLFIIQKNLIHTKTELNTIKQVAKIVPFTINLTNQKIIYSNNGNHPYDNDIGWLFPKTIDEWLEKIHPKDKGRIKSSIENDISKGLKKIVLEYRISIIKGEWLWLRNIVNIKHDIDKNLLLEGISTNISEYKKALDELLENQILQDQIFETIDDGIFEYGFSSKNLYLSPRWYKLLEQAPYSFPQAFCEWRKFVHPEDIDIFDKAIKDITELKKAVEIEYRMKSSNRWIWCYTKTKLFVSDNESIESKLVGIMRDITNSRQISAHLDKLNREFTLFMDNIPSACFIRDMNGKFIYENAFAKKTFDAEKWIGYLPEEIFQNQQLIDAFTTIHNNALSTIYQTTIKIPIASGALRDFVVRSFPIQIDKNTTMIGKIFNDITEEKNNREELIKHRDNLDELVKERTRELEIAKNEAEQANKAKGMFLANMNHEIRTPLNAIVGFTEMISMKKYTENETRRYTEKIQQAGKTLLSIVNNILDFSKMEAGWTRLEIEEIDVMKLIEDIRIIFEEKTKRNKLKFKIDIDPMIPETIFSDGTKIRQIIINLLSNAVKFTQEGFVALSVFALAESETTFTLRIEVLDSGIGIPEEQHDKIFEAFVQQDEQSTKKYGGTGLGLAIIKGIVEKMSGKIELKSKKDSGSAFVVTLPSLKMTGKPIGNKVNNESKTVVFNEQTIFTAGNKNETIIIDKIMHNCNILWENATSIEELFAKTEEKKPELIMMGEDFISSENSIILKAIPLLSQIKETPIVAVVSKNISKNRMKIIKTIAKTVIVKPVIKKELIDILKTYLTFTVADKENHDTVITTEERFTKELEQIDDIENFHSDMKWDIYPSFKAASNTKLISKIKIFSEKLEDVGNKHQISVLTELSSQLKDHLKHFNIGGMEQIFDKTKKILRILETTMERI